MAALFLYLICRREFCKIELDLNAMAMFPKQLTLKKLQFLKSPFVLCMIVVIVYQKGIWVKSAEVCNVRGQSACPADTCCRDSKCTDQGGEYICCADPASGDDCSNCPKCSKYISRFFFVWLPSISPLIK